VKGRKGLGEVDVLPCGPEAGGGAGKFRDRGTSFFPGCNRGNLQSGMSEILLII
jgi:hypothetical protein